MKAHLCRRDVIAMGASIAAIGVLGACSSESDSIEAGTVLAEVKDIPQGEAKPVLINDDAIIVSHTPQGEFKAHSAICTHQGCKVVPDDQDPEVLECPCHHSRFDTYTGEVLNGPATEDLPQIPVSVKDGKVITV